MLLNVTSKSNKLFVPNIQILFQLKTVKDLILLHLVSFSKKNTNHVERLYHTGSTPVMLTLAPWEHFTISINNSIEECQDKSKM